MKKNVILWGMAILCLSGIVLAGCVKSSSSTIPSSESSGTSVSKSTASSEAMSLSLDQNELALTLFGKATIAATVLHGEGTIVWASSDETIATVKDGEVTAKAVGSATITASIASLKANCHVTVSLGGQVPVISLSYESVELIRGKSISVKASVNFNKTPVENLTYTWTSSAKAIASTDSTSDTAEINAGAIGNATITVATSFAGTALQADLAVTVKEDVSFEFDNIALSEDHYQVNLISFVPTSYSGTLTSTFTPQAKVSENGAPVASPNVAYALKEGSSDGVVTVSDGVFSAAGVGTTIYQATYTSTSGIAYPLDITFVVTGNEITLDTPYCFDLHENKASFKDEAMQGSVRKVSIEKTEVPFETKDGTITLTSLANLSFGENKTMVVETSMATYTFDHLTLASMIISNKEELDLLASVSKAAYSKTAYPSTESGWGGYFLFDSDIDYNGTFTPFCGTAEGPSYWGQGFHGFVNGQGHFIRGLTSASPGGIFGVTGLSCVIENLGFVDAKMTSHGGFLTQNCYGTLKNIYFNGKVTADPNGFVGVFCSEYLSPSAMNNCVAELGAGGSYGWGTVAGCGYITSAGTIADSYVIASDANLRFTYTDKEDASAKALASSTANALYPDRAAFIAAKSTLTSFDTTYWDSTSGFPIFRSCASVIKEQATLKGNLVFDLSNGKGVIPTTSYVGTPNAVSVVGISCPFAVISGNLEIDISALTSFGEGKTIEITTDLGTYQSNSLILASEVIVDKAGLDAMGALAKTLFSKDAYPAAESGWGGYFVLGADIDYSGTFLPFAGNAEGATYWGTGFHGTFNGLGHIIKNLKIASPSGIFGYASIYSVIKNVAFTGADLAFHGGYLTQVAYGLIQNVYINGTVSAGADGFTGLLCAEFQAGAIVKQTILELTAAPVLGWGSVCGFGYVQGTGTIADVYAITNGASCRFTYTEKTDTDIAAFATNANANVYLTREAMAASSLNYGAFDATYWDLSGTTPTYRGA